MSFCWGASCSTSLLLDGTLNWGSGGQFTATFQVPATGWMGPDGVVPLRSGSYPVTIVCLGAAPGSMCLDTPVAQATSRLEVSGPSPATPGSPAPRCPCRRRRSCPVGPSRSPAGNRPVR